MKVSVNDSCIACGACESICDAVFSIEDKAVVDSSAVSGSRFRPEQNHRQPDNSFCNQHHLPERC